MAIVKMHKFSAIGIDTAKEALMSQLMEMGATELNSQDPKLSLPEWSPLVSKATIGVEALVLEKRLNKIDGALKILSTYDTTKKPLFYSRRAITESAFSTCMKERPAIEKNVNKVLSLNIRLNELRSTHNKIETAIFGLTHWAAYQIPLEISETKYTYILTGIVPLKLDINHLKNTLRKNTSQFELTLIGSDEEHHYVALIYLKEFEAKVTDILRQNSFNRVSFKDLHGNAAENISRYKTELIALAENITEVEEDLTSMVSCKESFQLLHDYLTLEYDKAKASSNMLVTQRTFYVDGWVPATESVNLKTLLSQHGCHYEITEPQKDEETPVLLKNNKVISPIETITSLYDTPNSREVDPTPIYAFFYICFFGIMFADMAYGLLLAFLSYATIKIWKLEGNIYKFIKQLGYCGVSTFIWGAIFGSFFGNLVTVASETFFGKSITIPPLWINPVENAMTMLIFACSCGVIHLFTALGVKAYKHIRNGDLLKAINDTFLWYILIIGLVLLLAGENLFSGTSVIGQWMSITGALGILLLPVFIGKGIGKALGLWNLYGSTRYLSDILSYARLLALCLAGSIVAQVFNIIASLFGSGIIGGILFIAIVVVAHAFNFLVSALGAFVHSIRLQYIEFYDKFYEGKGTPFKPFMKNTKYIKIVKEEI